MVVVVARQSIIFNFVTNDFLFKNSENSNHQILLKNKKDNSAIKDSLVKNLARLFTPTLDAEKTKTNSSRPRQHLHHTENPHFDSLLADHQ